MLGAGGEREGKERMRSVSEGRPLVVYTTARARRCTDDEKERSLPCAEQRARLWAAKTDVGRNSDGGIVGEEKSQLKLGK